MRRRYHHIHQHFDIISVVIRQAAYYKFRQRILMNINMRQMLQRLQVTQRQHHNNINVLLFYFGLIAYSSRHKRALIVVIAHPIPAHRNYNIYSNVSFLINNKMDHQLQRILMFSVTVIMKHFFFQVQLVDVMVMYKIWIHIFIHMYIDNI